MQTDDPRLTAIEVDGQTLHVPSPAAWTAFWEDPTLDGKPLGTLALLRAKVGATAPYPEIVVALGIVHGRVIFYELLRVEGALYRVFVEAVFCDHCGHRARISATPGMYTIYIGCADIEAARERGYRLPQQSCHACKRLLVRRRTVWQVND